MDVEIYRIALKIGRTIYNIKYGINTAANNVDSFLYKIGDKQMTVFHDKADAAAMLNPRYAEIENMRKVEGSDNKILFDEKLGLEELDEQTQIRDSLTSPPKLLPLYRYLKSYPINSFTAEIIHAYQRLTRSWDDTATWSLDYHLCLTLGNQLKHLADTTHGWPQSEQYPTFEDWQQALYKNSKALLQYANKDDILLIDDKYDRKVEEKIIIQAQAALYWVAQNLPALWD